MYAAKCGGTENIMSLNNLNNRMKRTISLLISVALVLCACALFTFASSEPGTGVYVTVSDGEGKLALALEKVTVTDVDGDGALTINDALYCAHEASYEGGAAAGYASEQSSWGLSLTKLWGVVNGGAYGYYVNNSSAMGLADTVKSGDVISAFVYTDATTWSDKYCYFDQNFVTAEKGDEITLKLCCAGYDANWSPISEPLEGASITVNGVDTGVKTDAEGNATIKLESSGKLTVSATSESVRLVPPVCIVEAESAFPIAVVVVIGAVVLVAAVAIPLAVSRKNKK